MKFANLLKTIGLSKNQTDLNNNTFNNTIHSRVIITGSNQDIDRIYNGNSHHMYYNPQDKYNQYQPSNGNVYFPIMYGQKGHSLKQNGGNLHSHYQQHQHQYNDNGGYMGYGHPGYSMPQGYQGIKYGDTAVLATHDYEVFAAKKKSNGSSVMTALTLLSFFFFLSTLQNCLKEHIQSMNPTVMVMSAGVGRNNIKQSTGSYARENSDLDNKKILLDSNEQIHYHNEKISNSSNMTEPKNTFKEIVKINSKMNDWYKDEGQRQQYIRIN